MYMYCTCSTCICTWCSICCLYNYATHFVSFSLLHLSLHFLLLLFLLFSSTKYFHRWLDGSCIEAQSQQVQGQDEPKTFTFFSDVMQHSEVNRLGSAVKDAIMSGMSNIMTSIGQWKKYRILWRLQRVRERREYETDTHVHVNEHYVHYCINVHVQYI